MRRAAVALVVNMQMIMHMLMYADIEECEQLKPCSHGCVNTVGSFRCSCPPGMSLSIDGRVCKGTSLRLYFFIHCVASFACHSLLWARGVDCKKLQQNDKGSCVLRYWSVFVTLPFVDDRCSPFRSFAIITR